MSNQTKANDWAVAIMFILIIATRLITVGFISYQSETTKAEIKEVTTVYEQNPVARWVLIMGGISSVLFIVAVPAFMVSFYIFIRRRVDPTVLGFYVNFVLLVTIINVLNDGVIFLAKFL